MKIQVLSIAEADLVGGFRFYERRAPGVGAYFLDSLYADIESLALYAGIHRVVHGYHRLLAARFPFAIYYEVVGEEVRVWRVLDCRRHPVWTARQLRRGR